MLQYNWCVVNKTSSPELPIELKERIERVVKERNEKPAKLLSCPIDSLPGVEEAQLEVRRRDRIDTGKSYTNEEAFAKLGSFRSSRRLPQPE